MFSNEHQNPFCSSNWEFPCIEIINTIFSCTVVHNSSHMLNLNKPVVYETNLDLYTIIPLQCKTILPSFSLFFFFFHFTFLPPICLLLHSPSPQPPSVCNTTPSLILLSFLCLLVRVFQIFSQLLFSSTNTVNCECLPLHLYLFSPFTLSPCWP